MHAELENSRNVEPSNEHSGTFFGKLLREFRKPKMTQIQLQNVLYDLDYPMDVTTLSKYESGERWPSASFIPYFAKALALSDYEEDVLLSAYINVLQATAFEDYLKGKAHVSA